MSPPRHNKDQGLCRYEDGAWGVDAYIAGKRIRKKIGGKQAARCELAKLKAADAKDRSIGTTGPSFDALRQALGTIEDQVAALREQLATARAREQAARSALAQLLEAVAGLADSDDSLAKASATAQRILEQLYLDAK